jgi:hypothetical protein
MLVHLFHMTVYDPLLTPSAGETTLWWSSEVGYNDPSAPGYHRPRIQSVVPLNVTLSADPRRAGPTLGVGSVTLDDGDGKLRALFNRLGVAGFTAKHYIIDITLDGAGDFATAQLQAEVKMIEPTIDAERNIITIPFQDGSLPLQTLLSRNAFAGSNALPLGVEGTPNDVGAKYKRSAFGRVRQIEAQNCNSSRGVDLLHDGQSNQILAARAGGVAWTVGSSRSFANIDNATDPSAGVVDYFLGDSSHASYARRRSVAANAGPFTYDLEGDKRGGTWRYTVADIANEWISQRVQGGPTVNAGDVTALNAASSAVVGFYDRDGAKVTDALNALLPSVHGKWWLDATGFRMGQLTAPAGPQVADIRLIGLDVPRSSITADIISWRMLTPDIPVVWRVIVRYRRFYSVQTQGLDANIDQAFRGELQNEWRSSTPAEDATVKVQYKGAVELTVDTQLDDKADADSLAVALLAMFKVQRNTLHFTLQAKPALAAQITMLSAVKCFDILDYAETGRYLRVLGRSAYDPRAGQFQMKGWG